MLWSMLWMLALHLLSSNLDSNFGDISTSVKVKFVLLFDSRLFDMLSDLPRSLNSLSLKDWWPDEKLSRFHSFPFD